MAKEFVVTPYEVKGEVDYDKLIKDFGAERFTPDLLKKMKNPHRAFRRGYIISHRDLDKALHYYSTGSRFAIVSGRGASENVHVAHLLAFDIVRYFQKEYGCFVFIPISNDEKFLAKPKLGFEESEEYAIENAYDVLALGFDPKKTKLMIDTKNMNQDIYNLAIRVSKHMTNSMIRASFGFGMDVNIGLNFYPAMQAAHILYPTYKMKLPVLVPVAIDQDPFIRLSRDIAAKLRLTKPGAVHSRFMRGLGGATKMSASKKETSIYTTDSPEEIRIKINSAFTGGRDSLKEQKELGGRIGVCSVFEYLNLLFIDDDNEIKKMVADCKAGKNVCGDCKELLKKKMLKFLAKHNKAKEKLKKKGLNKFLLK